MKHIIIGTTSINRSILHNDNMKEWYNYINKIDKNKYDIKWFINIDYIEKLQEDYDITKKNFENIITDIPITFIDKDKKSGNFLKACKNLSEYIQKFIQYNKFIEDDVIIIWLEDDWKLNINMDIPLESIIDNYLGNMTYINLTFLRNNYIHALAPSIISYKLWKNIHCNAWKNQLEHIDPEHCVGIYFLKNYYKYEHIFNITIITKYKKISENFFNQSMFNCSNSYYTYDSEIQNIINNKFIEKKKIKNLLNNKISFIRITCSLCIDGASFGRNFMKKNQLEKTKKQNSMNKDFYK